MALRFDWKKVTPEFCSRVRDAMNSLFERIRRPSILGPIRVVDLDLGRKTPEFCVRSLEPLGAFSRSLMDRLEERNGHAFRSPSPFLHMSATSPRSDFASPASGVLDADHLDQHTLCSDSLSTVPNTSSSRSSSPTRQASSKPSAPCSPVSSQSCSNEFSSPSSQRTPELSESEEEDDVEMEIRLRWLSDAFLVIQTEAVLHLPRVENFLRLPIEIRLSRLEIDGDAVVGCSKKAVSVYFKRHPTRIRSPLRDLEIETRLGCERSGSVLKLCDKVERFVVKCVKKVVAALVVEPNGRVFPISVLDEHVTGSSTAEKARNMMSQIANRRDDIASVSSSSSSMSSLSTFSTFSSYSATPSEYAPLNSTGITFEGLISNRSLFERLLPNSDSPSSSARSSDFSPGTQQSLHDVSSPLISGTKTRTSMDSNGNLFESGKIDSTMSCDGNTAKGLSPSPSQDSLESHSSHGSSILSQEEDHSDDDMPRSLSPTSFSDDEQVDSRRSIFSWFSRARTRCLVQ